MKKFFTLCLIMALSLGAYAQTKKIALLEPRVAEGSTDVSAMEKNMVRGELRKAIVNESGYEAFTRADIDQIMKEQNFQRTGMVSNDQIKRLGEMSGADYICISTLTKSSTEFYLEAYLINVEDGAISNPATQYGELVNGKLANMLPICKILATELVNSSGGRSNYSGGNIWYSSATNSVTDCQGHTYPVVKIGSQYWMAENMQCTKYDTQSEKPKKIIRNHIENHIENPDAPYYIDGRYENTNYSINLNNIQRAKLGFLYNWAAAMGYTKNQAKEQVGIYSGKRQGICPNGWHIPSNDEWNTLALALGGVKQNDGSYANVGLKLKSIGGWFEGTNVTDDYGFSALPTGSGLESVIGFVGERTYFWSSDAKDGKNTYSYYLGYNYSGFACIGNKKMLAFSVRCVRN